MAKCGRTILKLIQPVFRYDFHTHIKIVQVAWNFKQWYRSPDLTHMLHTNCGLGILDSECLDDWNLQRHERVQRNDKTQVQNPKYLTLTLTGTSIKIKRL